jgi:hypothetical protein
VKIRRLLPNSKNVKRLTQKRQTPNGDEGRAGEREKTESGRNGDVKIGRLLPNLKMSNA